MKKKRKKPNKYIYLIIFANFLFSITVKYIIELEENQLANSLIYGGWVALSLFSVFLMFHCFIELGKIAICDLKLIKSHNPTRKQKKE